MDCLRGLADYHPNDAAARVDAGANPTYFFLEHSGSVTNHTLRETGDSYRRMGVTIELADGQPGFRVHFFRPRQLRQPSQLRSHHCVVSTEANQTYRPLANSR